VNKVKKWILGPIILILLFMHPNQAYSASDQQLNYDEAELKFEWYTTFGDIYNDGSGSILRTFNENEEFDGYVVLWKSRNVFYGTPNEEENDYVALTKLDKEGNKQWEIRFVRWDEGAPTDYEPGTTDVLRYSYDSSGDRDGYIFTLVKTLPWGENSIYNDDWKPGVLSSGSDILLVKIDLNGNVIFKKNIDITGITSEGAISIELVFDSFGNPEGYILSGGAVIYTGEKEMGNLVRYTLPYVIKTDLAGNKLWEKTFLREEDKREIGVGVSVKQTFGENKAPNGYIISGLYNLEDVEYSQSVFLAKFDNQGNEEWRKIYPYAYGASGATVQQAFDEHNNPHGYIFSMHTCPSFEGRAAEDYNCRIKFVKTDNQGNIVWEKLHGGYQATKGKGLEKLFDANGNQIGYFIQGTKREENSRQRNSYFLAIDLEGNILWEYVDKENVVYLARQFFEDGVEKYLVVGPKKIGEHSDIFLGKMSFVIPPEFYIEKPENPGEDKLRIWLEDDPETKENEEIIKIDNQKFLYLNPKDKLGCKFKKKFKEDTEVDFKIQSINIDSEEKEKDENWNTEKAIIVLCKKEQECKTEAFEDKFKRDKAYRCSVEYDEKKLRAVGDTTNLFERNIKDSKQYSKKEVFLISDEEWQPVLQAVPATIWKERWLDTDSEWCNVITFDDPDIYPHPIERCAYPLLTYHKEGENYDADSIYHFIDQYSAGSLVSIKNYGTGTTVLDNIKISKKVKPRTWWQGQWQEKGLFVVVGYDNYKEGLIAAQLAAYLNAPLVFVGVNSDELKGLLIPKDGKEDEYSPKTIITVGDIGIMFSEIASYNPVLSYDESNRRIMRNLPISSVATFSIEQLQDFILYLTDSNKVILINPNDIKETTSETEQIGEFTNYPNRYYEDLDFETNYGHELHKLYYKDSLAAPILAVAKDELIVLSENEAFSYGISKKELEFLPSYSVWAVDSNENIFVIEKRNIKKLDKFGVELWSKEIDFIVKGLATDGNNVYIAGGRYNQDKKEDSLLVQKYDSDGNLVKEKIIPLKSPDSLFHFDAVNAISFSDGFLYILTLNHYRDKGKHFVFKLNEDLDLLWQKPSPVKDLYKSTDEITFSQREYSTIFSAGGKVYISFFKFVWGVNIDHYYENIIKVFDANLNHQKDIVFPNEKLFSYFIVDSDGDYYITDDQEGYLKYDSNGGFIKKIKTFKPQNFLGISQDDKIYPLFEIHDLNGNILGRWGEIPNKVSSIIKRCNTRSHFFDYIDKKLEDIANQIKLMVSPKLNQLGGKILTIIASPRAIPMSRIARDNEGNPLCTGGGGWFGSRDPVSEIRVDLDKTYSNNRLITGRIMGRTVSDTSAYIARIIFYKIFHEEPVKKIFFPALHFESFQYIASGNAKKIEGEFETECLIENKFYNLYKKCEEGFPPKDKRVYSGKDIVFHQGHGLPDKLLGALHSYELRNLNLGIGIVYSCLTNNYYQSVNDSLFSVNWLARGIGYYGSNGMTKELSDLGVSSIPSLIFEQLLKNKNLGDALKEANEKFSDFYWLKLEEKLRSEGTALHLHFTLLGDPTFKPAMDKTFELDTVPPEAKIDISPVSQIDNKERIEIEANKDITFDGTGSLDNTGILKYRWTLFRETSDEAKFIKKFTDSNIMTISLKIIDEFGNIGTLKKEGRIITTDKLGWNKGPCKESNDCAQALFCKGKLLCCNFDEQIVGGNCG